MSQTNNVVKHKWGLEVLWASMSGAEGKMLVFEKVGSKMPLHFHKEKEKAWFVNSGKFKVRWVDTQTAAVYEAELNEGQTFEVPALKPAQLECLVEGSSVTEVGTKQQPEDVYYIGQ